MRNYTMTLRTEAPVFVGDGGKIGKKEYIFMSGERRVYVPDMCSRTRFLRISDNKSENFSRDSRK